MLALVFGCLTGQAQQIAAGLPLAATAEETGQQKASLPGSVSGAVVDGDGHAIAGAQVTLKGGGLQDDRTMLADGHGYFSFVQVQPASFQLIVSSAGFAPVATTVDVQAGQDVETPDVVLPVAGTQMDIDVSPATQFALAEEAINIEEKQRLGGLIPNFYVVYDWHSPALNARQKFRLALHAMIDPANFAVAGIQAGVEQATNDFSGYGQGAQGYGKRFGALMADGTVGTLVGGAIFPALLRQDPRYFYKGTGSFVSRALYALATSFICKGDNGKWQPNYSSVAGDVATGAVSNLYYPSSNRNGAALTIENGLLNAAGEGVGNLLQEFLFKHITPSARAKP